MAQSYGAFVLVEQVLCWQRLLQMCHKTHCYSIGVVCACGKACRVLLAPVQGPGAAKLCAEQQRGRRRWRGGVTVGRGKGWVDQGLG